MRFSFKNYKPIDYNTWNFDGTGKNIEPLFNSKEKRVWEAALPYQDTREGEIGHAEAVTYFSFKLNDLLEGDRKVTIPTAILHDIGWSQLTESERKLFYETEIDSASGLQVWQRYEPILRARHQEQGSKLAKKILEEQNFPKKPTPYICETISQHDTRKGFLSLEDGIMRDADKLWRYTLMCFRIAAEIRGLGVEGTGKQLEEWINQDGFFYSDISREIAKIEMENTLKEYNKK